jgi:hypothetical protein
MAFGRDIDADEAHASSSSFRPGAPRQVLTLAACSCKNAAPGRRSSSEHLARVPLSYPTTSSAARRPLPADRANLLLGRKPGEWRSYKPIR